MPPFPLDEFTLTALEHAINTRIEVGTEGEHIPVGGDFTLSRFLDFMSGYDGDRSIFTGHYIDGVPLYEHPDQVYSEHDVIRALIARVRELEADVARRGGA